MEYIIKHNNKKNHILTAYFIQRARLVDYNRHYNVTAITIV